MLVAVVEVAMKYEAVGADVAVRVFPVSQEVSIPADPPITPEEITPSEEVAVKVYVPPEFPTSICPKVGMVEVDVPP